MEATEIKKALEFFTGTTQYYEHKLPIPFRLLLTDGCEFIREECKAYWLFDAILSFQIDEDIRQMEFQKWTLKKQKDETWDLILEDGNKNVIAVQSIQYSDFPLESISLFVENGVVLLPSEH